MPFNVSSINSINHKPLFFNANKYDSQKFVQDSYAVKGNLDHPERRTDADGQKVYFLA